MDLVHQLDPTRIVVLKSGWSEAPPKKLGSECGQGEAFMFLMMILTITMTVRRTGTIGANQLKPASA